MTQRDDGTVYLAFSLRAHDVATANHCLRVRDLVLPLARVLRLSATQCQQVSLAAALHDIGKIAVPRSILRKPDALDDQEKNLVRQHPCTGERLLVAACPGKEVLAAVRGHHERYDGSGYPDGLKGREIPLLARLLAVADVFDAMTSRRPYNRKPMPRVDGVEYLRDHAGRKFDPTMVLAFVAMMTPRMKKPNMMAFPSHSHTVQSRLIAAEQLSYLTPQNCV
jgi:HD-GYP domain-containing protein (c-di-GMP phosphodiesterase class II)